MTISHVPQANEPELNVQPVSGQDPLLHSIAESLRTIAAHMSASPKLGFVQPPRSTRIFANRTHGDRWYWRATNGEYELCPTSALSGRLVKLEYKEVTRRNQPVWKLWTTLESDRTYIIESGKESVFSKSLLAAIATLHPTDLQNILTLEVYPSEQNQESLFCNLYKDSERIYGKWNEHSDWDHIAQNAMIIVNQAQLERVTLTPDRLMSSLSQAEMTQAEMTQAEMTLDKTAQAEMALVAPEEN